MKIAYSRQARQDLHEIYRHISQESPQAATMVVTKVKKVISEYLVSFPEFGYLWQDGPTRAVSLAGIPYRIHYRVKNETLEILRIYHTARLPPEF